MYGGPEIAAEILGSHSCNARQISEGNRAGIIRVDIFQHRLELIHFFLSGSRGIRHRDIIFFLKKASEDFIQRAQRTQLAARMRIPYGVKQLLTA